MDDDRSKFLFNDNRKNYLSVHPNYLKELFVFVQVESVKSSVVFVWDLFRAFRLQACLSWVINTAMEILQYSHGTSISCCKEPHYAGHPAHARLAQNTSENSPSTLTLSIHVSVPFEPKNLRAGRPAPTASPRHTHATSAQLIRKQLARVTAR